MFLREALGSFALAGTRRRHQLRRDGARRTDPGPPHRPPRAAPAADGDRRRAAARADGACCSPRAAAALRDRSPPARRSPGAFASPITTLTRTIWRHRFEREEDRRTAFALDAVTIEINFTLGPAIVAGDARVSGATARLRARHRGGRRRGRGLHRLGRAGATSSRVHAAERHLLGPLTEPRLLAGLRRHLRAHACASACSRWDTRRSPPSLAHAGARRRAARASTRSAARSAARSTAGCTSARRWSASSPARMGLMAVPLAPARGGAGYAVALRRRRVPGRRADRALDRRAIGAGLAPGARAATPPRRSPGRRPSS